MDTRAENGLHSRRLKRERAARKRAEELLETKSRELYESQRKLQAAYSATVEVFASLIGGKGGRTSEGMRRMGREAMTLGQRLGLNNEATQTVYLASLLCDLGKLVLPDDVLSVPYVSLKRAQREVFHQHPQMAYESLMALPPLQAVANTVLCHCELANGRGYPRGISWQDVPLEAKVVGLVKDFDGLRRGLILDGELTEWEALEYLQSHSDDRYSAELVDTFSEIRSARDDDSVMSDEQRLTPQGLQPGMVVTRDVFNENGVLMLPAGRELQNGTIDQLRKIVNESNRDLLVYVVPESANSGSIDAIPSITATFSL